MKIISPRKKLLMWAAVLPLFTMACSILAPLPVVVERAEPSLPTMEVARPVEQQGNIPVLPAVTAAPIVLPEGMNDEESVLVQLYQQINPAVVSIVTYTNQGSFQTPSGQGSGFVVDSAGHIATNSHVVHGADAIEIIFASGITLEGELIGEDLHSDLAVVKVAQLPEGVNPLPLADINNVAVGQTVIAIGNPFGLGGTLTRGIVSAMGRTIPALTAFSIPQAIQTDAPINPGNSGGPLLNLRGEVIGVNAQIETGSESRSNSGVGFAIPVSIVARVVPGLIENGAFEWGWLGVTGTSVTPAIAEAMDLPIASGAYISGVVNNGPADKAGLRGSTGERTVNQRRVEVGGDVIIAVDGVSVATFEDILMYIALNTTPGQTITLTIIRGGDERQIELVLEPRPNETREFTPQP